VDDAHDILPVVEPDRDLDDWGRSARISGALDRTVWEAAHKLWFRAELQQAARIPSTGGALLIVNGGGVVSPIAPLLAKAVREDHPRRRDPRVCVDRGLLDQPGLQVLLTRAGAVGAQVDDLARLLGDEGSLVVHPVRTDRLHDAAATATLAPHPAIVAAVRTGTPIVPVVAVGADDAQPVLARVPLPGGHRLPITLGFPHLGLLSLLAFLPAKIRLRALTPLVPDTDDGVDPAAEAERLALSVARRLRHESADMLRARRSRWLG
jgi:1-acyl-sn-glycerol-3-phosphate acyltransferase